MHYFGLLLDRDKYGVGFAIMCTEKWKASQTESLQDNLETNKVFAFGKCHTFVH